MAEAEYAEFEHRLTPTLGKECFLGVRVPNIRRLAKEAYKSGEYKEFLAELPHKYYDENMLHGCILTAMKDYGECITELERFLPYIDNWAVCDSSTLSCTKKHESELIEKALLWTGSDMTYTCRYGINILMRYFLEEHFHPEYLIVVAEVKSDEYYINMMRAFYFATALYKQWDATVKLIEAKTLDKWTHNKSIQKAKESFRITDEQKEYLNTLKI